MKFKDLYQKCKTQLTKQVKVIWLEDQDLWKGGVTLKDYEAKLDSFLDECFTGKNILVEDMGEWESAGSFPTDLMPKTYWREWPDNKDTGQTKEQASLSDENIPLKDKIYNPFKHQVECWRKLLEEKKSICVTTGTGSGKTECFMVPLAKDLADNYVERHTNGQPVAAEPVQAIFLYPLNALMDDQRTRMSEIIECSGQHLNFAVYNGNTPDNDEDEKRNSQTARRDRRKHELVFRDEIRGEKEYPHPNILFTNPTMLEYLLLRKDDQSILKDSKGKLRWIVIDETHTFTGAGAAELALLIRRVLDAFDTPIENVRFATSSATVGDEGGKEKLKKFISDITGKLEDQIEIVPGNRSLQSAWGRSFVELHNKTFLTLDEMIPDNGSVEAKLEAIDHLCEKDNEEKSLRVKLHFFAKALNRGLYVDMLKNGGAKFQLMSLIPLDKETGSYDSHVLEAKYCSHCGTVFAKAEITGDNKLSRGEISTTSIFDDVDNSAIDDEGDEYVENDNQIEATQTSPSEKHEVLVTPRDNAIKIAEAWNDQGDDESLAFDLTAEMDVCEDDNGAFVRFDLDEKGKCPICGEKHSVRSFNVSASKVARILAPYLLDQADDKDEKNILFEGKQMIAFADSRKKAAKPTLEQNKESERKWVEWVVYNELIKKRTDNSEVGEIESAYENAKNKLSNNPNSLFWRNQVDGLKEQLSIAQNKTLSWNEALDALMKNDYCNYFAKQFAGNGDLNQDGEPNSDYKKRYVLAALYEVFKYKSPKSKTAETKGQIKIVFEDIEKLRKGNEEEKLPYVVQQFNQQIANDDDKIHLKDWADFLSLYIEDIRYNGSLFYQRKKESWDSDSDFREWSKIDINACRNLRTRDGRRRSTIKENLVKSYPKHRRNTELLSYIIGRNNYSSLIQNQRNLAGHVKDVMDELWKTLRGFSIIEHGQVLERDDKGKIKEMNGFGKWKPEDLDINHEEDDQGRMNLTRIHFTLPDEDCLWMCPVTNRVLTTTFKELTPFRDNQDQYGVKAIKIHAGEILPIEKPLLFIQSEHTAQLGRSLTKERIKDFKDHEINILSCSTTMEMGVDLGSVQLVEMTNIPPHPANYKQRAGRAGRRGQTRSVCMTICGSDGVDSRFFADSKGNVTKTINPPTVDLKSPQVLQRHINSYLFKQRFKTIGLGAEVKDLFTKYEWGRDFNNQEDKTIALFNKEGVIPNGGNFLGRNTLPYDESHTDDAPCREFINWLYKLDFNSTDKETVETKNGLKKLIKGSIYENGNLLSYVANTIKAMERLIDELDGFFITLKEQQEKAEDYFNNQCTDRDRANKLEKRIIGINYSFTSRLSENLLSYLSTHQFLPNANMPVNIVELKVSDARYDRNSENPTYDLATAIGQWAPGNYHTIKDTTYQIGGVEWDRKHYIQSIMKCNDCKTTWISPREECPNCHGKNLMPWTVNGLTRLRFLTPTAFVPTTDRSRITDNSQNFTSAKAELIGASERIMPSKGWFAYRISENKPDSENGGSNILIYNDGNKKGYQICKRCGKAQIEMDIAEPNDLTIITSFYNKQTNDNENVKYHNDLGIPCTFNIETDIPENKVFRNVILGGLIQTDYCEISFFREKDRLRLKPFDVDEDKKILTTLGVLICSFMVDNGICERNDVDFIMMGNGALCIYDKAKGGAGYSRQLDSRIPDALTYCKERLNNCELFQLLDSYSQRYAGQIDINATKEWLEEESKHREDVPKEILDAYPNARNASFKDIANIIKED